MFVGLSERRNGQLAGRDIGRVFGSVVAISDKLSASEYRQFVERLASELDKQVDG